MATNDVRPEDDGRTHVNVYSRGRTSLGRDLSNFAHLPFELDGLAFASVEGFWFWLVTGVDEMRPLHGRDAKRRGGSRSAVRGEPTSVELRRAYLAKLEAHPALRTALITNTLPLAHYYLFDGRMIRADRYLWTVALWEDIARSLQPPNLILFDERWDDTQL